MFQHKLRTTVSLLSVLLVLTVAACVQSNKKTENGPNAPPVWAAKMQALSQIFTELMPLVASAQKFSDPANKALIDKDTEALKGLAHSLKTDKIPPNSDPSLKMTAELFEEDIAHASVALKTGQLDSARLILRDTSSYCIQCHTQTNNGPNVPKLKLDFSVKDLTSLEKAELYTSLRRFDQALNEYKNVIDDKDFAKDHAFDWELAARSAVAISVKVEKDPAKTLSLVRKIGANPSTPQFVKESVKPWEASVIEWKNERKPLISSPPEILNYAEKIINRAQAKQKYPLDHSQDILYFRASGILHDVLGFHSSKDEITARALYLSGIAAENTRDLNFWTLHETYYELCIRAQPHTEISRLCYDKLNNSMVVGYSGSAGTSIPAEISVKLEDLKRLSSALPTPPPDAPVTAAPRASTAPAATAPPSATPSSKSAAPSSTSAPPETSAAPAKSTPATPASTPVTVASPTPAPTVNQ